MVQPVVLVVAGGDQAVQQHLQVVDAPRLDFIVVIAAVDPRTNALRPADLDRRRATVCATCAA